MRLEYLDDWPDCPVEGCDAKICIALDSPFCFRHTEGTDEEKRRRIVERQQRFG